MIRSSTSDGLVTYASQEWSAYTGQPIAEARGNGWLEMLRPDNRQETIDFFAQACASAAPFKIKYRIRRVDGQYIRVVVGAAPSMSPPDESFLGYLRDSQQGIRRRRFRRTDPDDGQFYPTPAVRGNQAEFPPVDVIADHLLIARSSAAMNGEERLLASLDFALSEMMRRLGYMMTKAAAN